MQSLYSKFNTIVEALTKAGLYVEFQKEFTNFKEASIEVKVNCGLAVLKRKGVIESINESGELGFTFTTKQPLTEAEKAKRYFPKHNGAPEFTEATVPAHVAARQKSDLVLYESMGLTPEEIRKLTGGNAPEVASLTEKQKKDFEFARAIGLSESDALIVMRM